MRSTLFATTALASLLAWGVSAQQATEPAAPATEAPAEAMPADPGATAIPAEPSAPAADTAEETMPDATPDVDTAEEPAVAPGTGTAVTDVGPELAPVAPADMSAEKLIGATIQTPNGDNIASIEDVILDPDGKVENVVAQFGGFLGFGSNKVLLTMDEIEVMQDEAGAFVVQTSLTPESLEGRPEYQAEN